MSKYESGEERFYDGTLTVIEHISIIYLYILQGCWASTRVARSASRMEPSL